MNELIKITTNEQGMSCVSARELHERLENKRKFTDWIKQKIEKYGFEENADYISLSQNCEKPQGGRPQLDYIITIDMAKELCMVENNEIGRKFRKYFIECEKRLKEVVLAERQKANLLLNIYNGGQEGVLAAKQLAELEIEEATRPLLDKIEEDKPLVTFADRIMKKGDNILVRELAKIISDEGYKIGERKLYTQLREWGYIFKHSTEPTQRAIDRGFFVVQTRVINTPYGEKQTFTTKVSPKGQIHIVEKILKTLNAE